MQTKKRLSLGRLRDVSIRTRLTVGLAIFLVVLTSLATFTVLRLVVINRQTEETDRKWLEGVEMLDDVENRMGDLRVGELSREMATLPAAQADAERMTAEQRSAIERLYGQYLQVVDGPPDETLRFRAALNAWLRGHDAWAANGYGRTGSPLSHDALDGLYRNADAALDRLIDRNRSIMETRERTTNHLVRSTIVAVVFVCAVAPLVGIALLLQMRRRLTEPLVAITDALTRLAAGDRSVSFPALRRGDEIGAMANAFEVFRANAHELERAHQATRAAQQRAQQLADHDALTGIPNRRKFWLRLDAAVAHARSGAASFAVVVIDLDGFKPINDLQGHGAGDLVLREVARRLRDAIRADDTVARLGGDEFALIVAFGSGAAVQSAGELADRLIDAISRPLAIDGATGRLGASIGIAHCPKDGTDAHDLLRKADIAMYRAKQAGGNQYCVFESSMEEQLRTQAELEAALRAAVDAGAVIPYYQPIVDMQERRLHGFEVLARWNDPRHGSVAPDVFVPLAEKTGLISAMAIRLLRSACRDSRQWPADLTISLNVSPGQLRDMQFATQLVDVLQDEGFPPARVAIEVTETALIPDVVRANSVLSMLRALGIKVALDDFGTGYSSLSLLHQFPFDLLKIDRSFIAALHDTPERTTIVSATVRLATGLGLPVVAEGIEDGETAALLARMGCRYGQGFHFGKPMPTDRAAAYASGYRFGESDGRDA